MSLFGRDRDLLALRTTVFGRSASCTTIVGLGGMGKTALARAFVRSVARPERAGTSAEIPDDICVFVDIASAMSRAEVSSSIERALVARRILGSTDADSHWAARVPSVLLVLDNAEQAAAAVADEIGEVLEQADHVRFVVTSRVPLGRSFEHVYALAPLDRESSRAVLLARANARGIVLDAESEDLRGVIDCLDGVPLALELAAGRLGVLSIAELRARLHISIDELRKAASPPSDRHRALGAVFAQSCDGLDADARRVLARCAPFTAPFTLEAACEVVGSAREPADDAVVDALATLVERRWIVRVVAAGMPLRFRLLEPVRAFANELLQAAGEADAVRGRLVARCARFAASAHVNSDFATELPHIAAALRYTRSADDKARLALAAAPLLARAETYSVQSAFLGEALAACPRLALADALRLASARVHLAWGRVDATALDLDALSPAGREQSDALRLTGRVARARGHYDQARGAYARALDVSAPNDVIARAFVACDLGELEHSAAPVQGALALAKHLGSKELECHALAVLGTVAGRHGDADRARELLGDARAVAARNGMRERLGSLAGYLGAVELAAGNPKLAEPRLEEAVTLARASGDRRSEAIWLGHLALVSLLTQGGPEALERVEQGLSLVQAEESWRWVEGYLLAVRAMIAATTGAAAHARADFERVRDSGRLLGDATYRAFVNVVEAVVSLGNGLAGAVEDDVALLDGLHSPELSAARQVLALVRRGGQGAPGTVASGVARSEVDGPTRIARDGASFEVGGTRLSLSTRPRLASVLACLAEASVRAPSRPVPAGELVAAGWPNERIVAQAATNRIHNAVAQLRRMGLRGMLVTRSDGYFLDPERVRIEGLTRT